MTDTWLVTTGASVARAPFFALTFLWVASALGGRIQRWLGVKRASFNSEIAVTALGVGAGALQFVPLVLGAARLLSVRSLRLAFLGLALCLASDLRAVAVDGYTQIRRWRRPPRWTIAWIAALVPGLLAAALLALTPVLDPDGLGGHLAVPKRWLSLGSLEYLPSYPTSNMPMGVEMLFTLGLSFGGDAVAKLLHFTLGIAGAVGLYLAGTRLRSGLVGAMAVTLYLFGPLGVGRLLGWAYLEGATSFASIAAILAWLIWFESRDPAWLRCAFLLAGIGVSFKLTAGLIPIGLAALTVVARHDARRGNLENLPPARAPAIAESPHDGWPPGLSWQLFGLCVLPVSPWLLRAAIVTHNPFFPMFARYIPTRDFPPELAAKWEYFNRYVNWAIVMGRGWSPEQRQLILAAVALGLTVIAGVTFVFLRSRMARATVVVFLAMAMAQLGSVGLYTRYWVPLASVLSLPVLVLLERHVAQRWQRILLIAGTTVASLLGAHLCLGSVNNDIRGLVRTAVGLEDQRAFLARHLGSFPLYDQINRELPPDARIMLSSYCSGFYIDRTTYCSGVVQGSLRLSGWDAFLVDVRRLAITHVVAARSTAEGATPTGNAAGVDFMIREEESALVGRLLREHASLLGSSGGQGLYALHFDSPSESRWAIAR